MSKQQRHLGYKTFASVITLILVWGIIVCRLFSVQVINKGKYQAQCRRQADQKEIVNPHRGTIYDREKWTLTVDMKQYTIAAHPYLINDKKAAAKKLSEHFSKSADYYFSKINNNKTYVILEKNVAEENVFDCIDYYIRHNAFDVSERVSRNYPLEEIAGPLIGKTDFHNQGQMGIEKALDQFLTGQAGWRITQKDWSGNYHSRPDMAYKEAINGSNIVTTINHNYQEILYNEIKNVWQKREASKAMGVIIDPNTGEILAMASVPSFDPNDPGKSPVSAQKNQVVTDIFEPGSTFKIVAAAAALEEGIVVPEDTVDCSEGYILVGGRRIHDHKKYNKLSFEEVIKYSSNVGTIKVAEEIGMSKYLSYIRKFGFGTISGLEFPGEEKGILMPLNDWTDLTFAQVAMGQGICATALQIAYAYAAIANGGILLKPQIVKEIWNDEYCIKQYEPEAIRRVASQKTMETLRNMLRGTVDSGTGKLAKINGMEIAGKTGTSQKVVNGRYSKTDYVCTFASFFPATNPRLLCVIVVDDPKEPPVRARTGGYVAAPAVKEVFNKIVNTSNEIYCTDEIVEIPKNEIKKPIEEERMNNLSLSAVGSYQNTPKTFRNTGKVKVPNVRTMTFSRACSKLHSYGLENIVPVGSGKVVSQAPRAYTYVDLNTEIKIVLKP